MTRLQQALSRVNNTSPRLDEVYDALLATIEDGRLREVVEIVGELQHRHEEGLQSWAVNAVFTRILSAVAAAPGTEAVLTATEIARLTHPLGPDVPEKWRWRLASMSAFRHSRAEIEPVLLAKSDKESDLAFLAAMVQERILRGEDWVLSEVARGCFDALQEQDNLLGYLPLSLTSIESDAPMPIYGQTGGYGLGLLYGPAHRDLDEAWKPGGDKANVTVSREHPERHGDAMAAFRGWKEESNGTWITVFAELDEAESAVTAGVLNGLELPCLENAERAWVWDVDPSEAFNLLFAAAAWGGARGGGHYGARGRMKAFQSISGLTGAGWPGYEALAEEAEAWQWARFEAESDWYLQIAWDAGLACLSGDGTKLGLVAATDTD